VGELLHDLRKELKESGARGRLSSPLRARAGRPSGGTPEPRRRLVRWVAA